MSEYRKALFQALEGPLGGRGGGVRSRRNDSLCEEVRRNARSMERV